MANYTITIEEILENPLYKDKGIFPAYYPFYEDTNVARKNFEEKFILRYQFHEIGFETVYRFQKHLEAILVVKMPYYRQLYETELKAKNIEFLLNKDLKETFIRTLDETNKGQQQGQSNQNGQANQNLSSTGNDTSSGESTNQSNNNHKESMLRDGVASSSLNDGYLTGVSSDDAQSTLNQSLNNQSTSESNQSTNSTMSTSNKTLTDDSHQLKETTELISQGNIGITSSAELLEKWRSVLINMDEIILDDCKDLFMKIY